MQPRGQPLPFSWAGIGLSSLVTDLQRSRLLLCSLALGKVMKKPEAWPAGHQGNEGVSLQGLGSTSASVPGRSTAGVGGAGMQAQVPLLPTKPV